MNGIHGVFGEEAALVPVPRIAPPSEGPLWPARMLAETLVAERLGAFMLRLLKRAVPVRKSSTATPGDRPISR